MIIQFANLPNFFYCNLPELQKNEYKRIQYKRKTLKYPELVISCEDSSNWGHYYDYSDGGFTLYLDTTTNIVYCLRDRYYDHYQGDMQTKLRETKDYIIDFDDGYNLETYIYFLLCSQYSIEEYLEYKEEKTIPIKEIINYLLFDSTDDWNQLCFETFTVDLYKSREQKSFIQSVFRI